MYYPIYDSTAQTIGIVILVIAIVLAIAAIVFVLFKFVFIRHSYERQIKELERKYSYLDALMIGQDAQYIRRLEMISRTNLLYVDVYNEYSKKFKHIFDIDDKYAEGVINQLKSLVKSKQYRQIKNALQEGKKALATFEEKAIGLDQELTSLIKPEEDSRQVALHLKEKLRNIKQTFYANASDLDSVSDTFNRLFEKLDKKFNEFETYIEGAEYDDANAILPVVDKVISQLENVLKDLPQLCILVNKIIPEKIKSLKEESESLHAKQYPLHHLMISKTFPEYDERLEKIKSDLINLQVKDVKKEAELIQKDVEEMHNNFTKEVDAKTFFDLNCDIVYQNVLDIEKRFLRLCSLLPEMNRIYKISEDAQHNIDYLKDGINRLGTSKRSLDTFIHSSTQQPYSILQMKLENLMKDYDEVSKGVADFKVYLDSLKSSSEEAYNLVFAYYYRLKLCEEQLRDIDIPSTSKKYTEKISSCYDLLNDIESKIKVTPIDIAYINDKVEELKNIANILLDDVSKDANVMQMAESAILIANRDRKHQNDVHQQLLICESQFFSGNFEKTYYDVVSLIKRRHVEESQNN